MLTVLATFSVVTAQAATLGGTVSRPAVAIIIDDLGNTLSTGRQLIRLPYDLTYSFLPHARHVHQLTHLAQDHDKEIMLHLPMEPNGTENMGPGGLSTDMRKEQFLKMLRHNMASVPKFVGVNNHMGSRLTRSPESMNWLMRELRQHEDMYFVDSFTALRTVAYKTAVDNKVPAMIRDVFLDHAKAFDQIEHQFNRLIRIAKRKGFAIAIGHPHPQTIAFLIQALPRLEKEGVQLVPVSQLIEFKKRRDILWRASLSPSPKAVKN